jgi:hypothetical protein
VPGEACACTMRLHPYPTRAVSDTVFQVFQGVFRYVASLCFKIFSCFRCMFQVFHTNVAKIDRDIALL